MKTKFLDLGRQPIANGFKSNRDGEEFKFNLGVTFDNETKLVSLESFVAPEMLFNDNYPYRSSQSATMRTHFEEMAQFIKGALSYKSMKVLEIGCNDGAFLKHFKKEICVGIEPCGNFARELQAEGYRVEQKFWNKTTAQELIDKYGKFDIVYSANCFCHIQDITEAFAAIKMILSDDPDATCILEDPSLLSMMQLGSYDQIYDEHAHVFSITALDTLCKINGLSVAKVDKISVHGFSNRVFIMHGDYQSQNVKDVLAEESLYGLNELDTYKWFADRVEESKNLLQSIIEGIEDKLVIGYGATSKATVVLNYCNLGPSFDWFSDTTPEKIGKFMPGTNVPILNRTAFELDPKKHVAFLGAWNYINEIREKEKEFVKAGGKFITHVPYPRIV